ncbi:MAG TPA: ABC transporter substrate-binding protein [Alphaproteobacteria bacterium]|jgi:NitT/TauT family transport system substrate-binding protein|nr:ABC transporter substrate-binding protein [Alphaproteobacteria bacterium]
MLRFVMRLLAVAAVLLPAAFAAAAPFKIIVPEPETPLVPNSVIDLAEQMGYYKKAGVDVEIVRVKATPAAIAALSSGQGDMANVSLDVAIQLVARNQMKLKGVISPDKALPFMIIAKKGLTSPKDLEGKVFGVGQVGSVDYAQTRNVLANLGVDIDKIKYLAIGQPSVRAQSLIAGQIDATTVALGTYLTMPSHDAVDVMLDAAAYYKAAPFVTKVSVVTADTAAKRAKEVAAVVKATIAASRDFSAHPEHWVDGMVKARPDVPREQLEALAKAYAGHWSVDGGLDAKELTATTDALYKSLDFKDLPRKVDPKDWIDRSFIDTALDALGSSKPAGK